jgi:hypothetical protein
MYVSDVSLFVLSLGVNEHVLKTWTFPLNSPAQHDNCAPNQVERAFHHTHSRLNQASPFHSGPGANN